MNKKRKSLNKKNENVNLKYLKVNKGEWKKMNDS